MAAYLRSFRATARNVLEIAMNTMTESEAMEALDLDPEDPQDLERFRRDQRTCNCDIGYHCYNPTCRANYELQARGFI